MVDHNHPGKKEFLKSTEDQVSACRIRAFPALTLPPFVLGIPGRGCRQERMSENPLDALVFMRTPDVRRCEGLDMWPAWKGNLENLLKQYFNRSMCLPSCITYFPLNQKEKFSLKNTLIIKQKVLEVWHSIVFEFFLQTTIYFSLFEMYLPVLKFWLRFPEM